MATNCKPLQLEFQAIRKVVGDFEGGRLSTDGGALLLRQADALLDLTPRLAACFEDHRSQRRVEHPVRQLVSQRLFGLLPGYEDVNDHDQLRADSVLALAVGRPDRGGTGPRPRHSAGRAP